MAQERGFFGKILDWSFGGLANEAERGAEGGFARAAGTEGLVGTLASFISGSQVVSAITGFIAAIAHMFGNEEWADRLMQKNERLAARLSNTDEGALAARDGQARPAGPGLNPNAPSGPGASNGPPMTGNPIVDTATYSAGGYGMGRLTALGIDGTAAIPRGVQGLASRFVPSLVTAPPAQPSSLFTKLLGRTWLGKAATVALTAGGIAVGASETANASVNPDAALTDPGAAISQTIDGTVTVPSIEALEPLDAAAQENIPELTIERGAGLFMGNFYESAIDNSAMILGAPVDGVTWIINQPLDWLDLGQIEEPFLGSESISDGITPLYNWYAETFAPGLLVEPETDVERALALTGDLAGDFATAAATAGVGSTVGLTVGTGNVLGAQFALEASGALGIDEAQASPDPASTKVRTPALTMDQ